MSFEKVIKYLTRHPWSCYYKHNVSSLMQHLGMAEANSHLLWLILINDKAKSNLAEVPE